jgi:excisionase family DNA binding protein
MKNKDSNPNELISANSAGRILGVSGKTVIRMMEDGEFAGYRIGLAWKYRRNDIENYLESRRFEGGKSKEPKPEEEIREDDDAA